MRRSRQLVALAVLGVGLAVTPASGQSGRATALCTDRPAVSATGAKRIPVFVDGKVVGEFEARGDTIAPRPRGALHHPAVMRLQGQLQLSPAMRQELLDLSLDNIAPERSLVITSPAVTTHLDLAPDDPLGRRPFAFLMKQLADAAGTDPVRYVRDWLAQWEDDSPIRSWPSREMLVPRATAEQDNPILAAWKHGLSIFELPRVPFRLLAIVNRIDLREDHPGDPGDAGELRFVFAATAGPPDTSFLVIFEYEIDRGDAAGVRDWAQAWCGLGRLPIDSAGYREALAAMIRPVVSYAGGRRPRLAQVRTNENLLIGLGTSRAAWQLREFGIDPTTGALRQRLVSRTPGAVPYMPEALHAYLASRGSEVQRCGYELPEVDDRRRPFRGHVAETVWDRYWIVPGIDPSLLHEFALRTCNGCHHKETKIARDAAAPASFAHVFYDRRLDRAEVSSFLGAPSAVPDPRGSSRINHFDEMGRRRCYLDSLVKGLTTPKAMCASSCGMGH